MCANQKIHHMKHVIFHPTFHQTCRKIVGLVCSGLNMLIAGKETFLTEKEIIQYSEKMALYQEDCL